MKIKGKKYINGKLFYEGEYIYNNGQDIKYNGKGYGENGCLIYELINGNGKLKNITIMKRVKLNRNCNI